MSVRDLPSPIRAPIQGGFSLVEVMVAVTVSLILLGGLLQVLTSNKEATRIQGDLSVLQENGRFAIGFLEYALRMSSHWGGAADDKVSLNSSGVTITGDCSSGYSLTGTGLYGYEGASSSPLSGCIANEKYVPNSDILVVRYADVEDGAVATADLNSAANKNDVFVRTVPGRRAWIFKGLQVPDSASLPADLPDSVGTKNYPFHIAVFFVRPCSVLDGGSCTDGVPTLTQLTLSATTLSAEPLIEGIEQMQLAYGVDSDGDGSADRYYAAGSMSSGNWSKVTAVRLGLIARTEEQDYTYTDSTTYSMPGAYSYTPAGDDQHYHRKYYEKVVQIRNRSRQ